MNIQDSLNQAKIKLSSVADHPVLEAELLLAYVFNKPRSFLYTSRERELSQVETKRFFNFIERRCQKEPIAYLLHQKEFWSLNFFVSPHTLIPRPETELLIETVLQLFAKESKLKIADLGTGCGTIALALAHEFPMAQIIATDIDQDTLAVAKKNALHFQLKNVSFQCGNWCQALTEHDFDLIISNPPYIAASDWSQYAAHLSFEPIHALVSGLDGFTALNEISSAAKNYLKPGGTLLLEHGFNQGEAMRKKLLNLNYQTISTVSDLGGLERVTMAKSLT